MPQSFNLAVLAAGVVLVLLSLTNRRFSAWGFNIAGPKGRPPRIIAFVLGIIMTATAIALELHSKNPEEKAGTKNPKETTGTPIVLYEGQEPSLVDIVDYRFPFDRKKVDRDGAVNTAQADWRFTAPRSGIYEVEATFTSSYQVTRMPSLSCQIVIIPKGATLRQGQSLIHSFEPHCETRQTLSLNADDIVFASISKSSGEVNNVEGKFSARFLSPPR